MISKSAGHPAIHPLTFPDCMLQMFAIHNNQNPDQTDENPKHSNNAPGCQRLGLRERHDRNYPSSQRYQ